jgi:ribosomal protein L22
MLGRQISGKPIDYAILQMQFSEKRASKRITSMLVLAKQHAINYKGLDPSKLTVCKCLPFHAHKSPLLYTYTFNVSPYSLISFMVT